MNPKLLALFDKHASATFDKQSSLNDMIGDLDWEFGMETGTLRFGNKYRWKAQVLGTQSEQSGTWLWAWGNKACGIPEKLLDASNLLRKLGKDDDIPELCETQLPVADQFDGHFWATLATGLCRANAYFRGPYKGGAVFLLIQDADYPRDVSNPLGRLLNHFSQSLITYNINDHKQALLGHADWLGLSVQSQTNDVIIQDDAGNSLVAKFDDQSRLTLLTGKMPNLSQITSKTPEKTTFFEAWLKNCRTYYKGALLFYGTVSIAVGLITWFFTSLGTACITAVVVYAILGFVGFIEYGE
jgi:hypothetical protein